MSDSTPALPDYVLDPNAVLKDVSAKWRHKKVPDYTKTRADYELSLLHLISKKMTHEHGTLISMVENLVKNWEIEASYKADYKEWRTVDHDKYTFAVNGGPATSGEHMLNVGTYNAIIAPNAYYSPEHADFASSHVTFKTMMPTFAWEVLEVYSGPPTVAFRWRHWGEMKNDYKGFNEKGKRVTVKAHGKVLDIEGVSVAVVNDKLQIQKIEVWFDPLEMFRQMGPVAGESRSGTSASVATKCPMGF
ncbi:hypothetical protein MSAN_01783300 [Mycena sanguinolenta]|uniref:Pathogen-related protein n=1 Tax=Mycena sanguinolenta TaxID=230812 RepID=A0A8H7CUB6_9AGAR|nr:hypothetical protein MSAN_01783300 [Mycena sanguinolenta]